MIRIPALRRSLLLATIFCYAISAERAFAQELEPLAYAHNPVGIQFAVGAYSNTWGDILFDASSPVTDVTARWEGMTAGYGATFDLFGRAANFAVAVPYVWGRATGKVNGDSGEAVRNGLADPRLRLGINLIGGPALTPEEFFKTPARTTLGATLVVAPPLGEYFPDKLINLGANRWSVKTELGLSHPIGQWRIEAAAGIWWFTDNDEFFGGTEKAQDPISAYQLHAIYTIRPQFWFSAGATWYRGGTTVIDGTEQFNFQSNTRFGLTASYPIGKRQSLKLAYNKGVTTRIGGAFRQVILAWQYSWF